MMPNVLGDGSPNQSAKPCNGRAAGISLQTGISLQKSPPEVPHSAKFRDRA